MTHFYCYFHRETALRSGDIEDCREVLLDTLEGKQNDILYLTNVSLDEHLKTTETASMSNMKSNLENLGNKDIAGITSPTVYVGTQFATFSCHREDCAFCAVNRHIAGGTKIWYVKTLNWPCRQLYIILTLCMTKRESVVITFTCNMSACCRFCIPARFYSGFQRLLTMLPLEEKDRQKMCYLQHKEMWLDPRIIMKAGIPVFTVSTDHWLQQTVYSEQKFDWFMLCYRLNKVQATLSFCCQIPYTLDLTSTST